LILINERLRTAIENQFRKPVSSPSSSSTWQIIWLLCKSIPDTW